MKISGKITWVSPLQQGTSQRGSEWRMQTIVVEEDDPQVAYPNEAAFNLFNDRIPAEPLTVGAHVEVYFGMRTREYNNKWYNEVNVIKIYK
ncbi:MAG: DUF3127 domain-containing protein [Bacteroidaceae bacterium]|nr:DUF3127 domain-containing protein [Bacteroidaceae bacterium]